MSGNPRILPSDRSTVVGVIDPDAYSANTYSTGWVDMGMLGAVSGVVMVGDMVSTSVVTAKLEQALTDGGSPADVVGKTITPLTQAGADGNKQAIINCRAEELDVNNGYRFVRLTVTVADAASDMAAVLFGTDARYQPYTPAASVDEIVR